MERENAFLGEIQSVNVETLGQLLLSLELSSFCIQEDNIYLQ